MTLRELIEELEEHAQDFGDETEVRLAQQPNWPFEYSVGATVAIDPASALEDEDDEEIEDGKTIVYIGEGSQLGYLPGSATRELGWGRNR